MTVKDVDKGYRKLVDRVYGLEKPEIKIGVFESDADHEYDDGITLIEVAITNEFGTDRIPERSFIRAWFDENAEKCRESIRVMMVAVLEGKYTKHQALELVAQKWVGEIQKRMAEGIPPPNAPATIEMKGSSVPLTDTGQLRSSITYAIDGKQAPSALAKSEQ